MESPYRPPRELDASEQYPVSIDSGAVRFTVEQQRMIGRLAKYLRDIGGLLIFLAVLTLIGMVFTSFATLAGRFGVIIVYQVANQSITIVFLFLIGRFMRAASVPLKAIAESPDGHIEQLMDSMANLVKLYGAQIAFLLIGIVLSFFPLVL